MNATILLWSSYTSHAFFILRVPGSACAAIKSKLQASGWLSCCCYLLQRISAQIIQRGLFSFTVFEVVPQALFLEGLCLYISDTKLKGRIPNLSPLFLPRCLIHEISKTHPGAWSQLLPCYYRPFPEAWHLSSLLPSNINWCPCLSTGIHIYFIHLSQQLIFRNSLFYLRSS